jgi:23S rRNA pseudouridine2605 synthase
MKTTEKLDNKIRLNKYLADSGIASRRKADRMIEEGHVKINGRKVFELGVKVDPDKDTVTVQGETVRPQDHKVYFMFYKPKNVVTTMFDPEDRPCIADYTKHIEERVYPVGRLDWETEGLLILTNDGEFSNKVMHPSQDVTKTYLVKIDGQLLEDDIARLKDGVTIVGGKVQARSVQKVRRGSDLYGWYRVVITEGKNRQVHRMFEKIGYDVLKLQRVAIGSLELSGIDRGEMRPLTARMIEKVFQPEEEPTSSRLKLTTDKGLRIAAKRSSRPTLKATREHVQRSGRPRGRG